jgi:quinolinate synthase
MQDIEALRTRLTELRRKRNAVLLAHNYQLPEIQDVADILGDSLQLASDARDVNADVIVFCGVDFMAETAKILSPERPVLHPDPESRCPMAAMVEPELLQRLKDEHPEAVVVSYVNTTADVKALSDVCCTSANAVKIVKSLPEKEIIFTPDRNLGQYVQRFVRDKDITLWPGFCHTHQESITIQDLKALRDEHPSAVVMVHPECTPEVIDIADEVFSTGGMVRFASESDAKEFIVGTEKEMAYRLRKENPGKAFYHLEKAICPDMKRITLEKVVRSLERMAPKVELPQDIIERARSPIERMVEIGRGE